MRKIALIAIVGMALAACGTPLGDSVGANKQNVGGVLGAIGGAVTGAQFGKGDGQLVAVAVGTLAGAMIGSNIGATLDRADQMYLNGVTQRTLETQRSGETVPFRNPDTGLQGSVTAFPAQQTSQGICRPYTTNVVIDGQGTTAQGTACRGADGVWRIASG